MARRFSHYETVRLLARGGQAAVYLGRDTKHDVPVAIKILSPAFSENDKYIQRFEAEARRAASLRGSKNIVTILSSGRENDDYYIVMEYVEGKDLRKVLEHGTRIPQSVVVCLLEEISGGLADLHREGIIHRDIKPANILLSVRGDLKITDLGLAKQPGDLMHANLSLVGDLFGTPNYMSPEQAARETIDPATDFFSLGIVAYEMLAGKRPFLGRDENEVIRRILTEPPPRLSGVVPGIDPGLEDLVMRMLRKERTERLANGEQAISELEHLADTLPGGARSQSRRRQYVQSLVKDPVAASEIIGRGDPDEISQFLARVRASEDQEPVTPPNIGEPSLPLPSDPAGAEGTKSGASEPKGSREAQPTIVPVPGSSSGVAPLPKSAKWAFWPRLVGGLFLAVAVTVLGWQVRGRQKTQPAPQLAIPVATGDKDKVPNPPPSHPKPAQEPQSSPTTTPERDPESKPVLEVESIPPGARILYARNPGAPFQDTSHRTPHTLTLPKAGNWRIRLELDQYHAKEFMVNVQNSRMNRTGQVTLTPIPAPPTLQESWSLTIRSSPSRATADLRPLSGNVNLEQPNSQLTPCSFVLPRPDAVTVTLTLPGYVTMDTTISGGAGEQRTLYLNLKRRTELPQRPRPPRTEGIGILLISVDTPAHVRINGECYRQCVETQRIFEIPVKGNQAHVVDVIANDTTRSFPNVFVAPGDTLKLGPGTIRFRPRP